MAKVKVTSPIVFPETLDLSVYSGNHDNTYKLTSVIIHTGPTAYSGHYIAHIRQVRPCVLVGPVGPVGPVGLVGPVYCPVYSCQGSLLFVVLLERCVVEV